MPNSDDPSGIGAPGRPRRRVRFREASANLPSAGNQDMVSMGGIYTNKIPFRPESTTYLLESSSKTLVYLSKKRAIPILKFHHDITVHAAGPSLAGGPMMEYAQGPVFTRSSYFADHFWHLSAMENEYTDGVYPVLFEVNNTYPMAILGEKKRILEHSIGSKAYRKYIR